MCKLSLSLDHKSYGEADISYSRLSLIAQSLLSRLFATLTVIIKSKRLLAKTIICKSVIYIIVL